MIFYVIGLLCKRQFWLTIREIIGVFSSFIPVQSLRELFLLHKSRPERPTYSSPRLRRELSRTSTPGVKGIKKNRPRKDVEQS
jgi:hypothetical protein